MPKMKLNKEEQELLASIELCEWRSVRNLESEKKSHKKIAKATFRKDSRVNIRLPKRDVTAIQVKAMEDGIPYQTLMASILHRYVTGKLVEKSG